MLHFNVRFLYLPFFLLCFLTPFEAVKSSGVKKVLPHPFFVAVTEVSQNTAEKSLEVSCKFFTDDFEETLQKAYKTPLDILSGKDKAAFDKLIPDYISKRLALTADGKAVRLSFIGFEVEKESVFCYFEVQNLPAVKQLDISNSLLHDFKNEQINIMHVTINGKRQSTKLDFPSHLASFRF